MHFLSQKCIFELLNNFRNPDDPNGGLLVLGGSDPDYYEGDMHYVDLSAATYWQVAMKG